MTESFLGAMREFVLAQAQECFWQQAVMRELSKGYKIPQLTSRGLVQRPRRRQAFDEGVRVLQGRACLRQQR
jgi:hypothetical protein